VKTRFLAVALAGLFLCVDAVRAEASEDPVDLEYPCQLVGLSNPDSDCWTGMDVNGLYKDLFTGAPVPVDPARWLVGAPPSEKSGVTLPTDHWIELGFCGPIGDGPGPDIVLTEQGTEGEQALILVGDGKHCPYPIATVKADLGGTQTTSVINIDLAGVTMPFVPTTIRVVSLGLGGASPGFDVGSVRARIVPSQTPLASYPYPPDDACDVPSGTILKWRPGLEADKHIVYFGKTLADVNEGARPVSSPPQPQAATGFDPGPLQLGQRYYWRVDEVDGSQADGTRKGDIWGFQVADCVSVEDFESSDLAWQFEEGWYAQAAVSKCPDPVYGGYQAMDMEFKVWYQWYTGLVHMFDTPQDWTAYGAKVLALPFYGRPDNPEMARLYLRLSDGQRIATVTYSGDPSAITDPEWHLWKIPIETFAQLDLSRVHSIVLGVFGDPNGPSWPNQGVVTFDSIALCTERCDQARCRRTDLDCDCRVDYRDLGQLAGNWLDGGPRILAAQEPNAPIAWYPFDGNANDRIGSAHGQLGGLAWFTDGRIGQALSLSGVQESDLPADHVRIPNLGPVFEQIKKGLTIAFWQLGKDSLHWVDTLVCSDFEYGRKDPALHIALGDWDRPGHYQWHCGSPWTIENSLCGAHRDASEWAGRWNHWTFTKDFRTGRMDIFLNGSLYARKQGDPSALTGVAELVIGNGWYGYYDGLIDDLRIYDYAMGQSEAAYLATDGSGVLDVPLYSTADLNGDGRTDWQDFALLAQDWLAGPIP